MAIGSFNGPGGQMPMAEINMTPMVDVMLVLLIIFIVAAPLMTHAVAVDLPKATSQPAAEKPKTLQLSIAADGTARLDGSLVPAEQLETRFREAVGATPDIEMRLQADRTVRYEIVAETMSAAQRAGLNKIGFITQPTSNKP